MFETLALPPLLIKGMRIDLPIVQGGMGAGISLSRLASAVARTGGLGLISSVCLDRILGARFGRKFSTAEAVRSEVEAAKVEGGYTGINIMVALQRDYEVSVRSAIEAGVNAIVSGAGLPLNLPEIKAPGDTALIPIVSSARALKLICRRWERARYRPDAVVLEGPLAGGHLGFRMDQVELAENTLERLLPPVKELAQAHGDFPVIVAGGVYTHDDVRRFLALGADGVQLGTRFLATEESSASDEYKQAVLRARPEDIVLADNPGVSLRSAVSRAARVAHVSVGARAASRAPKCTLGYVLGKDQNGRFSVCAAKHDNERFFCICGGLWSATGCSDGSEEPLYTVGVTASRVDRILSVSSLMAELAGLPARCQPALV